MAFAYWKVTFALPQKAVSEAENSFDDLALSISVFETDEARKLWVFELLSAAKPDMAEIQRRLFVLSALHGFSASAPLLQRLEQEDWLKKVARGFPPLTIGRFFIHGAHVTEFPLHAIEIQVDAGAAFGSGEHNTTRGCLEALSMLSRRNSFRNILDMGCGSGILAIAAAKLWRVPVLAADIDPIAVAVTRENARINKTASLIDAFVSDGYENERIKKSPPFNLIVSNILARPLVAFAKPLARHLAPHGFVVLSGLLVSQEKQVLSAHMAQGLKLCRRIVHGDWCTLVLES